MEFLGMLYTILLVSICLMLALLLHRSSKPQGSADNEELKAWLTQQLEAQAKEFEQKQAADRRPEHERHAGAGPERPAADPDPAAPEHGSCQ